MSHCINNLRNTMKSNKDSDPTPLSRQLFMGWYNSTTMGQKLRELEASYLLNVLQLTYKQNILQVGFLGSEVCFIGEEFRQNLVVVSTVQTGPCPRQRLILAELGWLPVASESIDVLILPHALEFEPDPHGLLQEAERILKPEGQLIIFCLNPWSVRGLFGHLPRRENFWSKHMLSCSRLVYWLSLLKFEAEFSAGFGLVGSHVIYKPRNLIGQSMACLAPAYAVRAVKRTYTMIAIRPAWQPASALVGNHAINTSLLRKH